MTDFSLVTFNFHALDVQIAGVEAIKVRISFKMLSTTAATPYITCFTSDSFTRTVCVADPEMIFLSKSTCQSSATCSEMTSK
jgi:hypothetical protein